MICSGVCRRLFMVVWSSFPHHGESDSHKGWIISWGPGHAQLVIQRGAPEFIRCDNGRELTANTLRDWCRFQETGSAYIEPGSPWQNPYVESFNSRIRDECLNINIFWSLAQARVVITDWKEDYNHRRRHSSLGYQTPVAFAAARPTPSASEATRTRSAFSPSSR